MPMPIRRLLLFAVLSAGSGALPQEASSLQGRVVAAEDGAPVGGCTVTLTGHQATGHPLHWSWMEWCDPTRVEVEALRESTLQLTAPDLPAPGREGR